MDTSHKINREAMLRSLDHAAILIRNVIREIEAGEHDDAEAMAMSIVFEPILRQLCIAWHSKWMTEADIAAGGQDLYCRMGSLVPNWGLSFAQLIDVDEPRDFDCRKPGGWL